MAKSTSSKRWLREHFDDPWVRRARDEGWRSRAVYKLEEIAGRDRIFHRGQTIVDLGAAPGGWSQWCAARLGPATCLIALDILPLEPLPGVTFIQGDFTEQAACDALCAALDGRWADVVLSDMAPNISGLKAIDAPRAMALSELAAEFAAAHLKPGGTLLVKAFQGAGFDRLCAALRVQYDKVAVRKPRASRPRSPELYLLARGLRDDRRALSPND